MNLENYSHLRLRRTIYVKLNQQQQQTENEQQKKFKFRQLKSIIIIISEVYEFRSTRMLLLGSSLVWTISRYYEFPQNPNHDQCPNFSFVWWMEWGSERIFFFSSRKRLGKWNFTQEFDSGMWFSVIFRFSLFSVSILDSDEPIFSSSILSLSEVKCFLS